MVGAQALAAVARLDAPAAPLDPLLPRWMPLLPSWTPLLPRWASPLPSLQGAPPSAPASSLPGGNLDSSLALEDLRVCFHPPDETCLFNPRLQRAGWTKGWEAEARREEVSGPPRMGTQSSEDGDTVLPGRGHGPHTYTSHADLNSCPSCPMCQACGRTRVSFCKDAVSSCKTNPGPLPTLLPMGGLA